MGGLTEATRLRIVALVVGGLAGLAMVVVGCTSVTEGSPKVNAADAPIYKASVSASSGGVGRIVQCHASRNAGSR